MTPRSRLRRSGGFDEEDLRRRFSRLSQALDERSRRLVLAAEARALGRGGLATVHRATGVARSTLSRGLRELEGEVPRDAWRVRLYGGGRKRLVQKDPTLLPDLIAALGPRPVRGASRLRSRGGKSVRQLAEELTARGHAASYPVIAELLKEAGLNRAPPRRRRRGRRRGPGRS